MGRILTRGIIELVEHVEVVRAIPKDAYGVNVNRVGAVSDDAVIDLFRIADVVPSSTVGLVRIPVGDEVQPVVMSVCFHRIEPRFSLQQRIFIVC